MMMMMTVMTFPSSQQLVENLGCGEHVGAHSTLLACIQVQSLDVVLVLLSDVVIIIVPKQLNVTIII